LLDVTNYMPSSVSMTFSSHKKKCNFILKKMKTRYELTRD